MYINLNFLHTVFQNCNDMHLFYVDVTSYVTHFENVVGPNDHHHPCGALSTVGLLDFFLHGVPALVIYRPGILFCRACFYFSIVFLPRCQMGMASGSSIHVDISTGHVSKRLDGGARQMDGHEGGRRRTIATEQRRRLE